MKDMHCLQDIQSGIADIKDHLNRRLPDPIDGISCLERSSTSSEANSTSQLQISTAADNKDIE
jgi:hypothetical protein